MSDNFQLQVRIELVKLDPAGHGWTGERMNISEQFEVGTAGFLEVAAILGKFHDLATAVEQEHKAATDG